MWNVLELVTLEAWKFIRNYVPVCHTCGSSQAKPSTMLEPTSSCLATFRHEWKWGKPSTWPLKVFKKFEQWQGTFERFYERKCLELKKSGANLIFFVFQNKGLDYSQTRRWECIQVSSMEHDMTPTSAIYTELVYEAWKVCLKTLKIGFIQLSIRWSVKKLLVEAFLFIRREPEIWKLFPLFGGLYRRKCC